MDRPARRVGGQRRAPVADPPQDVEQTPERRLADGDRHRPAVGARRVAAPQARRRLERDRARRMRPEMGLDLGDDGLRFGIDDLDRGLDRRRNILERKVEHRAANRDDPPDKRPRSHRNHSLPRIAILARRNGPGKAITIGLSLTFSRIELCQTGRERRKAPARRWRCASRPRMARSIERHGPANNSRGPSKLPHPRRGCAKAFAMRDQMKFSELGLSEKVLNAVEASGYDTPTPIQAQAIPHALARPRHSGHRPDGHRQDRRLHPAHAVDAGARPRPGAHAADPHSRADPRTRGPGRRGLRQIRRQPQAERRAADRRRLRRRSEDQDRPRRRRRHRDPRPTAGPHRTRRTSFDRHRNSGHRRSRPHARHGLHSRHRAHLQAGALHPPDAVLLGDDAAGNHPPNRNVPA